MLLLATNTIRVDNVNNPYILKKEFSSIFFKLKGKILNMSQFATHFFEMVDLKVSNFLTSLRVPLGNGTNVMSNAFWGKYQKITSRFSRKKILLVRAWLQNSDLRRKNLTFFMLKMRFYGQLYTLVTSNRPYLLCISHILYNRVIL